MKICSYLFVCLSITGLQWKQFDSEKQYAVSLDIEQQNLELGVAISEHQPWHYSSYRDGH